MEDTDHKLKCETHPEVHQVSKGFQTWSQNDTKVWQIGKPVHLSSKLFCGSLYGFTRTEPTISPQVMRHYPPNKRLIIRVVGVFLKPVKVRDLWLTGIFEKPPLRLPMWPIIPAGRFAAQFKSPHLVLNELYTERCPPQTSTPLFPMIDTLNVTNMEGKTLKEALDSAELCDSPIKENWVDALGFVLPSSDRLEDPTGHNYRKKLNKQKNLADWPSSKIFPGQFVVMEFVNDSLHLPDLVASWAWKTCNFKIDLTSYIPVIPFGAFDCDSVVEKRGDRWMCREHKRFAYDSPSSLTCCFPPIPREKGDSFLWFVELSKLKEKK